MITEKLLQFVKSKLRIVRDYGEDIEQKEYPLPRTPRPPRRTSQKYSTPSLPKLTEIALHHLVRMEGNHYSAKIQWFDRRFVSDPDEISDEDIRNYNSLLIKAKLFEISRADVLLATCSASGSPRMTRKFARPWTVHSDNEV